MVYSPAMKSTKCGTLLGGGSRRAVTTPSNCNIIDDEDELSNMRDFGERKLDDIAKQNGSPETSRQTAVEMTPNLSDRPFRSDAANNYYHAMIASKPAVKPNAGGKKGQEDADSTEKSLEDIVAHALTVAKTPEDVARYLLLNSSTSASLSKNAFKTPQTVPPVSSFENYNDNETTISAITQDILARSPGGPINATRQSSVCSVTTEVKSVVEELLSEHDPPIESYPSPICSPEDDTPGYPEKVSPLPSLLPDDSMGIEKNKCNSNDDSTAASTNPSEDESNEERTTNIAPKETIEPSMSRKSLSSNIMAAIRRTTSSESRNSKSVSSLGSKVGSKDQSTKTYTHKSKKSKDEATKTNTSLPPSGDGFADPESHEKASTSLGSNAYEMCEAIVKGDRKMNQSQRRVESDNISVAYSATEALSSTGVTSTIRNDSVDFANSTDKAHGIAGSRSMRVFKKNKSNSLEETSKKSLPSISPFFNGRTKVISQSAVLASNNSTGQPPKDGNAVTAKEAAAISKLPPSKSSIAEDLPIISSSSGDKAIASVAENLDAPDDEAAADASVSSRMSAPSIHSKKSACSDTRSKSPIAKLKKTLSLTISKESRDDSKTKEGLKVAANESRGKSPEQRSKSSQLPPRVPVKGKRVAKPAQIEKITASNNNGSESAGIQRGKDDEVVMTSSNDDGSIECSVYSAEAKKNGGGMLLQLSSTDAIPDSVNATRLPISSKGTSAQAVTLKERKDKFKRILTYRKKTNSSPTSQAVDSATIGLVKKSASEIGPEPATESNYQVIGSTGTADTADDDVYLDKPDTKAQSGNSIGAENNRLVRSADKSLSSSRKQPSKQSTDDGSKRDTVTSLPGQNAENNYKSSAPLGSIEIANRHPSIDAVSLPRELKHSKVQIWNEPADIDSSYDKGDIGDGKGINRCQDGCCQGDSETINDRSFIDGKGQHCKGGSRFACESGSSLMSEVSGALSDIKNGVRYFQGRLFGACDISEENGIEVLMDNVADAVIAAEEKIFGIDDEGTLMGGQGKKELHKQKKRNTTEPKWVKSKKDMTAKDMMIANAIELEANEVDRVVNDVSEYQGQVSCSSEQREEKKKFKYLSKLRAISLKHL